MQIMRVADRDRVGMCQRAVRRFGSRRALPRHSRAGKSHEPAVLTFDDEVDTFAKRPVAGSTRHVSNDVRLEEQSRSGLLLVADEHEALTMHRRRRPKRNQQRIRRPGDHCRSTHRTASSHVVLPLSREFY